MNYVLSKAGAKFELSSLGYFIYLIVFLATYMRYDNQHSYTQHYNFKTRHTQHEETCYTDSHSAIT
jgi:hypothetical protein